MEQCCFKSLNLTLSFFFFLFCLPSPFSLSRLFSLLHNIGTLYLSLEISFILKLKHDYIYIYVYVKLYIQIYIHGSRFGYTSECKTHNRLPHQPSLVLANCLRPPRHTPLMKLKWVQFRSMQTGFVGCGQNLNRPNVND